MTTEYRLAVRRWGKVHYTYKRDVTHARKGLYGALKDMEERWGSYVGAEPDAWIESREVSQWKREDVSFASDALGETG